MGFVGAGYVGGKWFGMAKYGVMFGLVQPVASLSSAFGQTGISIALHEMTWRQLATNTVYVGIALLFSPRSSSAISGIPGPSISRAARSRP